MTGAVSSRGPSRQAPRATLLAGLQATTPLLPGVAAFGLVYGVLARQTGLGLAATFAMSALVFAGASQFTAIGMWGQAGGGLIVLSTLIINLRHLLMGASMAPHLRKEPGLWKALLAFGLADESYALAVSRYLRGDGSREYFLGVNLGIYVAWFASGLLGGILGGLVVDPGRWGIGLVFPLAFLGLLMPLLTHWVPALVAILAGATAVGTASFLPGKANIFLAILVGSAAGAFLERRCKTMR